MELITEQIFTVWNGPAKKGEKPVASMLCLNITGAFDRVAYPRLLYYLKKKGIPEKLVGFVKFFLIKRQTTIRFGAFESELFGIEVGIPQGSVLLLILFFIFVADLLEVYLNMSEQQSRVSHRA